MNQIISVKKTLQPVRVDGWLLFAADGEHWLRDIDLAERAGLAEPRKIRRVVKGLVDDGIVTICDNSGATEPAVVTYGQNSAGAVDRALVYVEETITTKGNGAAQKASEYYLNLQAALHVLMRLRTPVAVQLQVEMVRVFTAVLRGEVPVQAAAPPDQGSYVLSLLDLTRKAIESGDTRAARAMNGALGALLGDEPPPAPASVVAPARPASPPSSPSTEERPARAALREWLKQPGRTQGKLAAAVGVRQAYISQLILRDQRPSRYMAELLEQATGIPWQGWFMQKELVKADRQLARARAFGKGRAPKSKPEGP